MASTRATSGERCARTSTSRAISGNGFYSDDLETQMTDAGPISIANFSHVCIGVSDIEAALAFYTRVLGMDVVFDVDLDGASLETITGRSGEKGRMVGGL